MTVFEAYITNLGKYAEGQLVGETLKFPATTEEVQSLLKNIGVDGVRYLSLRDHGAPKGLRRPLGAAVRAAEKAVGGGEPMICRGAALCRSPAFTTSGQNVSRS